MASGKVVGGIKIPTGKRSTNKLKTRSAMLIRMMVHFLYLLTILFKLLNQQLSMLLYQRMGLLVFVILERPERIM